ncbi:hypothetical protein FHW92_000075 [Novosphingobium sp. SG707]|nr:hypothetical protein [Novosphingobium sp. SG707]
MTAPCRQKKLSPIAQQQVIDSVAIAIDEDIREAPLAPEGDQRREVIRQGHCAGFGCNLVGTNQPWTAAAMSSGRSPGGQEDQRSSSSAVAAERCAVDSAWSPKNPTWPAPRLVCFPDALSDKE